jgi:hypothetical protein
MNESKMLDAESAGTGFAISVAMAEKYNGQEIGSIQALIDAGVFGDQSGDKQQPELDDKQSEELKKTMIRIIGTYREQYEGWLKRNVFERQWVLRDFKKTVGMTVDDMNSRMDVVSGSLERNNFSPLSEFTPELKLLKTYYERQYMLLQGYEKDPKKLRENSDIIISWIKDIDSLLKLTESEK